MTSAAHTRASERVAEVSAGHDADLVVMVQGDEPMIQPAMIAAAIEPLQTDASVACVNLAGPIRDERELHDPNTIKVVVDRAGHALFFSRSPVPHSPPGAFVSGLWLKQVCVIVFRRTALQRFVAMPPGRLEVAESVDMLRFLENRVPVRIVPTDVVTYAVDTAADLARVEALLGAGPSAARAWR
jgi:3-deoxy-manno-octulosonate cytidylyltransferase (CMP-KDO synthetase)